jgi:hypothetical protein
MTIEKKINNIIWHIETNRKVLGDKAILDAVLQSLKILKEEVK